MSDIVLIPCSLLSNHQLLTVSSSPPPSLVDTMRSGGGLPAKNSLLTSSHGSVMTVTTVAEEGEGGKGEEEVGRVGGWIASFDKLLRDPLGVMCLQVSRSGDSGHDSAPVSCPCGAEGTLIDVAGILPYIMASVDYCSVTHYCIHDSTH